MFHVCAVMRRTPVPRPRRLTEALLALASTAALSTAVATPASAAAGGSFTVMTYNIAGLPEGLSSAPTPRAPATTAIGLADRRLPRPLRQRTGQGRLHLHPTLSSEGCRYFGTGLGDQVRTGTPFTHCTSR